MALKEKVRLLHILKYCSDLRTLIRFITDWSFERTKN